MKKIFIHPNQRGLRFHDCKVNPKKKLLLLPGKHPAFCPRLSPIEVFPLDAEIHSAYASVQELKTHPAFASATVSTRVGENQLALRFLNGHYRDCLGPGEHTFWRDAGRHDFFTLDLLTENGQRIYSRSPYIFQISVRGTARHIARFR